MFFPVASLLAMAWFVIRVFPQPGRIAYPCQQFAAVTVGTYLTGAMALGLGLARRLRRAFGFVYDHALAFGSVAAIAGMIAVVGGLAISSCNNTQDEATLTSIDREAVVRATPSSTFESDPYADKTVVRVYDPTMSTFKVGNTTDYYYRTFDAVKMQRMLEQALYLITGASNPVDAWKMILPNVSATSKVAVKVNHNDIGFYPNDWYKSNNTDPPLMIALTKSLQTAGVQQPNITFFDRSRNFPSQMKTDVKAQCPNVVMQGASDNMAMSSTKITLSNWSGCDQTIPQVAINADYLIDLFLFKSHDGGITGSMKNLAGLAGDPGKVLHNGHEWSGNKVLPDLASQASLRKDYGGGATSKWRLFISEAFFLCQNPTEYISSSVASKTDFFPGGLPSSMFVSRSPFMIDNVLLDFMSVEKTGSPTNHTWKNSGWINNSVGRYTNWVSGAVSAGSIVTGGLDMPPKDLAYNASTIEFISVPNSYALTTSATNGTVTKSPAPGSNGKYTYGTTVTLTATPAANYEFTGWSGDVTGTTNPATITMTGAKTVTATFGPSIRYTLTTSASGGSIALNPTGGTYVPGTVVTLTATPMAGYTWGGWSGDLSGTANPTTITMNGNKSVTAIFNAIPRYTLTTSATNGTIGLNPPGGTYYTGTTVTLTATAATGFKFIGWDGDVTGTTNPASLVMTANKSVTANFEAIPQYIITTSATNGTVGLNPPGGPYYAGTTVTLTAQPDAGFGFAGWDGDLIASGTTNPVTLVVSSNLNVIANFAVLPLYTLTTSADNGTVNLNPPSGTYYAGTAVTLTAVPSAGYVFSGWSGDLGGNTNPVTLTMTGDKAIVATFVYNPYYTIATSSGTNGTIALNPPGGSYLNGTVVTLTATPSAGYTFSGWSGDLTGTSNPTTLTVNANKTVTATFTAIPQFTLATSATNGTIALNPPGGTYYTGTVVTLTATPSAGYKFSGWSGSLTGTTNPTTLTMNANKSVTASFTYQQVVTTLEAESLARTASAVGSNTSNDANASGGVYTQLTGTPAVGDWLEFTTTSLTAATYDIKMTFKSNNNRGINQASIDGVNQGSTCDEYAATAAFKVQCALGSKSLTAGTHKIRFTMKGKNAASSGYSLTVDSLILTSITGP